MASADQEIPSELKVRRGVPNVYIEDLDEGNTSKFGPPKDFAVRLISKSAKDRKAALHRFFSFHIGEAGVQDRSCCLYLHLSLLGNLWGFQAIPWGSDLGKYFRGAPRKYTYSGEAHYDSEHERAREYLKLKNPLTMDTEEAATWFKHIVASENGELPEEEALCFIGRGMETFPLHCARRKGAIEDKEDGDLREMLRKRKRAFRERTNATDKRARRRPSTSTESEAESSLTSDDDDMSIDSEDVEIPSAVPDSRDEPTDDGGARRSAESRRDGEAERAERMGTLASTGKKQEEQEREREQNGGQVEDEPSAGGEEVDFRDAGCPSHAQYFSPTGLPDPTLVGPLASLDLPEGVGWDASSIRQSIPETPAAWGAGSARNNTTTATAGMSAPTQTSLNNVFPPCAFTMPLSPSPQQRRLHPEQDRHRLWLTPLSRIPGGHLPSSFFNYARTADALPLLNAFLDDEEQYYKARRRLPVLPKL